MHETQHLRSFGLIVGGIFALMGVWPVLWRAQPRLWSLLLGGVLMTLALVVPRRLAPVYRLWMIVGEVFGWINTHLLLSVLFYGLLTPMGLLMRLRGQDPMRRTLTAGADTYRVARQPRPASHMWHQF